MNKKGACMLKFYDMPVGLGKDREKSLLFYLNDMAQKTSGFVFEYCPQLVTLDNVPDDIVQVRQMLTPATITDLTEQDNLITSVVRRIHSIEYYDFEYPDNYVAFNILEAAFITEVAFMVAMIKDGKEKELKTFIEKHYKINDEDLRRYLKVRKYVPEVKGKLDLNKIEEFEGFYCDLEVTKNTEYHGVEILKKFYKKNKLNLFESPMMLLACFMSREQIIKMLFQSKEEKKEENNK